MTTRHEQAERLLALRRPNRPPLLPNGWDAGTHGFCDEAIEGVEVRERAFS